jgi:oligopeptide transport system permease protein
MLKYTLKRILEAIPVLILVVTFTFFFIRLAPGGPFDSEKNVPPEVMKNLNERYNLNAPPMTQYLDYVGNLLKFDFGPSFRYPNRSVNELIGNGFPVTFELGFYAILFALLMGLMSGLFAALKKNTLMDYVPMSLAMIGICFPSFLLGPILALIFGIWLEILPVSGWESPAHKILPSITLGSAYAAYIARLSRSGMLETLSQDFIRTARAKGVPEKLVVLKHALKGSVIPVISFLGPAMAGLLSGSFVVETVFNIHGLGRFYVQAAFNRDYTMIMGTTIMFSTLILFMNMVSDIATVALNPKLGFKSSGGGS